MRSIQTILFVFALSSSLVLSDRTLRLNLAPRKNKGKGSSDIECVPFDSTSSSSKGSTGAKGRGGRMGKNGNGRGNGGGRLENRILRSYETTDRNSALTHGTVDNETEQKWFPRGLRSKGSTSSPVSLYNPRNSIIAFMISLLMLISIHRVLDVDVFLL